MGDFFQRFLTGIGVLDLRGHIEVVREVAIAMEIIRLHRLATGKADTEDQHPHTNCLDWPIHPCSIPSARLTRSSHGTAKAPDPTGFRRSVPWVIQQLALAVAPRSSRAG